MEELALKDIHLPQAIGWWPPAPGWWLLLILILFLLGLGYGLYRRLTCNSALKSAYKLLSALHQQANSDTTVCLRELSSLLRRVAISRDGRDAVAHLHGPDWLSFLDQGLNDAPFSNGVGRCLADAHYRPTAPDDVDLDAVFALCERWLKQQEKRRC